MFDLYDEKNRVGVLSREVEITVETIKGISDNSFLSSDGMKMLISANEIAKQVFAGCHGITDNGHLVPIPEKKRKFPHPKESLFLDVNECGSGLINLKALLDRSFLEQYLFKGIESLSLLGFHLHCANGGIILVSKDKFGIVLSEC